MNVLVASTVYKGVHLHLAICWGSRFATLEEYCKGDEKEMEFWREDYEAFLAAGDYWMAILVREAEFAEKYEQYPKQYKTLDGAKRSARRRFGVREEDWREGFESSQALHVMRDFVKGRRTCVQLVEYPLEGMEGLGEFALGRSKPKGFNRDVKLLAAETLLQVETGVTSSIATMIYSTSHLKRATFRNYFAEDDMELIVPGGKGSSANFVILGDWMCPEHVHRWLENPSVEGILRALSLADNENISICWNAMTYQFDTSRNLEDCISLFCDLAETIPPWPEQLEPEIPPGGVLVNDMVMDPAKIPDELQPLIPFAKKWAISDDVKRARKQQRASVKAKRELVELGVPLLPALDTYLDQFRDRPMPEEAVLMLYLGECIAELRLKFPDIDT